MHHPYFNIDFFYSYSVYESLFFYFCSANCHNFLPATFNAFQFPPLLFSQYNPLLPLLQCSYICFCSFDDVKIMFQNKFIFPCFARFFPFADEKQYFVLLWEKYLYNLFVNFVRQTCRCREKNKDSCIVTNCATFHHIFSLWCFHCIFDGLLENYHRAY